MKRSHRLLLLLAGVPLLLAGEPRPLSLETFEGEPVQLALEPGEKALVVHFWASWCPECAEELPILERALRACEGAAVRVVMVNVGESPGVIARFREAHALERPVLRDPDGDSWRRFARGMPANLFWTPEARRAELGPRDEAAWGRSLAELGCAAPAAR